MKDGIYRSRLGKGLERESAEFISSLQVDKELLRYEIESSKAHTVMLASQGIISRKQASALLKALSEVEGRPVPAEGFEDVHEYVESVVTRSTSEDIGGRLHTARSRNDQVATITRMACRDRLLRLCELNLNLSKLLIGLSKKHARTPLLAYTHLQRGQVQTLGHHLQSYAQPLLRDAQRLIQCYDMTNRSPLGASAIAGSTVEVDRRMTARLLGFDKVLLNCEDSVESRDFAAEAIFVQTLMLTELSRVAEDLILWSTSEFGYFELPDSLASPSSAMPHKKNPDVLELVRAAAPSQMAKLVHVLSILKALPSGYNRDLQPIKEVLYRSFDTSEQVLHIMIRCFSEGVFNEAEMRRKLESSEVFALPLAEWLVRMKDIPFRKAHAIAGRISAKLASKSASLSSLNPAQLADLIAETRPGFSIEPTQARELSSALNCDSVLQSTLTEGGPSAAEVLRTSRHLQLEANQLLTQSRVRRAHLNRAARALNKELKALVDVG